MISCCQRRKPHHGIGVDKTVVLFGEEGWVNARSHASPRQNRGSVTKDTKSLNNNNKSCTHTQGHHILCYDGYVLDKTQLKCARYGKDDKGQICVLYDLINNTSIYHVYKLKILEKISKKRVQYEIDLVEKWPKNGESAPIDQLRDLCSKGDGDGKNQAAGVWPAGCKTEIRK